MKKTVLVIGTGTIGLPLTGLLARHKSKFDIDSVLFNKNTPLKHDSAQIKQLIKCGAELVTDKSKFNGFKGLGMSPVCTKEEAIENADVVIDCTPKGIGLQNKREFYDQYKNKVKGFVAQGSENGFGSKFGYNIVPFPDGQFVQVVSCNTHNIAALIKSFENDMLLQTNGVISGNFVCMRRSNDVSQDSGFVPSIKIGKHDDNEFGTHHCRDVFDLMKDQFPNIKLYSSAIKLNTQYMHSIRFSIELDDENSKLIKTKEDAIWCFKNNSMVALTDKTTTNSVFSFGRDFGLYGRILSQAIICEPSVAVTHHYGRTVVTGVSMTPQDGNSLISSVYSALFYLDKNSVDEKIKVYSPYIFQDI